MAKWLLRSTVLFVIVYVLLNITETVDFCQFWSHQLLFLEYSIGEEVYCCKYSPFWYGTFDCWVSVYVYWRRRRGYCRCHLWLYAATLFYFKHSNGLTEGFSEPLWWWFYSISLQNILILSLVWVFGGRGSSSYRAFLWSEDLSIGLYCMRF